MTDYRKARASFVFFVKLTSLWNPVEEAAVSPCQGPFRVSNQCIHYKISHCFLIEAKPSLVQRHWL